jgi:N-acetylglucosaminyldiphosphoundecaprenol N-acetyl-beta-D-mannosaminyltransferase
MDNVRIYELLGVEINPLTITEWHSLIEHSIKTKNRCIILSQNLHSVYTYYKDLKMQSLHKIAYKHVDGMPLIIWGKILGYPLRRDQRVTWVDWIHPLMEESQTKGWKIFYLGSKPEVATAAKTILKTKYDNLQFEIEHGYFNANFGSRDNYEVLDKINSFKPDILIVGMGMPRQEHWIYDNYKQINVKIILTSGAAMEYVTGVVSVPPRWMGKMSLEWLYRMLENPKRFWKRYLIEPWYILPLILRDLK